MSGYRAEPAAAPGDAAAARCGILLVNVGTPAAPEPRAVRRYLAEFLADRRVVELPRLLWWPLLHGLILPLRPAKSARKYAHIWTPEGSPLALWSARQAALLGGYLGQAGRLLPVRAAMRYGQPAIAAELQALRAAGVTRVLVLPLYPQYSGSTTGSAFDAVAAWARAARRVPELRFVHGFHDEPAYIAALAARVRAHWQAQGRGPMLLISFHGMPARSRERGDPYHDACHATARLLARELSLAPEQYRVTFQSRFGRARWLQPYTQPTLVQLARAGVERVDVICPGFVADCLETLEEIDQEGRAAYLGAGGREFHYLSALNDRPEWIDALRRIALRHLQGWDPPPDAGAASAAPPPAARG